MTRKDEDLAPEGMDGVIRRLQNERPQLEELELDNMKRRVLTRVTSPKTKGAALKGRIAVAVLSLGVLGAGAGGVVAASGGSGNGASSAVAQYRPPTSPPKALTGPASSVTAHAATLNGSVFTGRLPTSYYFRYGRCPFLGHSTGTRSLPAFPQFRNVAVRLTGLKPKTLYCYQLVAFNRKGRSFGSKRSFSTLK